MKAVSASCAIAIAMTIQIYQALTASVIHATSTRSGDNTRLNIHQWQRLHHNPQQQQEQFTESISALTVSNAHGSIRHGSNNLLPLLFKWRRTVGSGSGRSKKHVKFDVQNDDAS
jgi:hypothetical protein